MLLGFVQKHLTVNVQMHRARSSIRLLKVIVPLTFADTFFEIRTCQYDIEQGNKQQLSESVRAIRQYSKGNTSENTRCSNTLTHHCTKSESKPCYNCGFPYSHNIPCPAKGKECNYCHQLNHFVSVCRRKLRKDNCDFVKSKYTKFHPLSLKVSMFLD